MRYFLLLSALIAMSAHAQQSPFITRGPYLQAGTDTSMVIRWRTSSSAVCKIYYGTQVGQQTNLFTESAATGEHEVRIGGLQPFTQYYYTIYRDTQRLAGNDTSYAFITNPVPGTVQPVHVWVIGDMGRANQQQRDVRDAYFNNVRNGRHTDVWLWLGDNVYNSGTDQEYQDKMFAIYPEIKRQVVSRPAPGNHDYGSVSSTTNDGPYYQNFTMTKNGEAGGVPSNEEGYYSYDYGNVHFVSLNSEVLQWYISANSAMCNWLKADLAATTQPWKIVYWHQPPYTKGSHDSDDAFSNMGMMRSNINPILEQYGVDLVLTGHSHDYERSYPISGHYGNSSTFNATMQMSTLSGKLSAGEEYHKYTNGPNANKGTVYTVCGNSGSTTSGEPLNHPIMHFSQQGNAGFMTIDVNGMQLDANYYDDQGAKHDEFTIIKSAQNPSGTRSLEDEISELNIYPNPFSDVLRLEMSLANEQNIKIDLVDITGRVVAEMVSGKVAAGKNTFALQTRKLAAGNYIVRIKHDTLGETGRLVTLRK